MDAEVRVSCGAALRFDEIGSSAVTGGAGGGGGDGENGEEEEKGGGFRHCEICRNAKGKKKR